MKYEYKFTEVPLRESGWKSKTGDGFNRCKEIIIEEAYCYQIIFERVIEE